MAFQKFIRQDHMKGMSGSPFISIRPHNIAFNAEFTKLAELNKYSKVTVFLDRDNYKIGFSFHNNDDDKEALSLMAHNRGINRSASISGILRQEKWIAEIAKLDPCNRQFGPVRNKVEKLWVIQLCPAFEKKVSNVSDIPVGQKGIYQYKRDDNEVVYIGKGDIKTRVNAPERKDWEFDTVEYSLIESEDDQFRWEKYWLDKFVEQYDRLPIYNKISGRNNKVR